MEEEHLPALPEEYERLERIAVTPVEEDKDFLGTFDWFFEENADIFDLREGRDDA
jgi:hypothetical protein